MAFKCNFTFLKLSYDFNLKLGKKKKTKMICESYIGDPDSMPGWGRSSGGGHCNSLQNSSWRILMDGEALWVTIHGAAKSQT